jgi:hypothetical protein
VRAAVRLGKVADRERLVESLKEKTRNGLLRAGHIEFFSTISICR